MKNLLQSSLAGSAKSFKGVCGGGVKINEAELFPLSKGLILRFSLPTALFSTPRLSTSEWITGWQEKNLFVVVIFVRAKRKRIFAPWNTSQLEECERAEKMEKLSNLKKIASFIFTEDSPQTRATERIKHQKCAVFIERTSREQQTAAEAILVHIKRVVCCSASVMHAVP